MRQYQPSASDLLTSGWLPPNAAADMLGISVRQLDQRVRRGEVKRREVMRGTGLFLYEVSRPT